MTTRAKSRDRVAEVAGGPLRLTPAQAAQKLNIHYETLRSVMTREVFTVIAPRGRGVGKRVFLYPDEVEVYATGGEHALRDHRVRKGRLKPRK